MKNINFSVQKLLAATELHTLFNNCMDNIYGQNVNKEFDYFCYSTPTNNTHNGIIVNAMFESDDDVPEGEDAEGLWDAIVKIEDEKLVVTGYQYPSGGGASVRVIFDENGMVEYSIPRTDRATDNRYDKLSKQVQSIFIEALYVEPTDRKSVV